MTSSSPLRMCPVMEYEASKVVIRPEDYLVQDTARNVQILLWRKSLPVTPQTISVQRKGVGKFIDGQQKYRAVNIGNSTSRPFQCHLYRLWNTWKHVARWSIFFH